MNLGKIILSSCILLASLSVYSDVDSKLNSWWDSVHEGFNANAPGAYKVQGSTGYAASAGGVNWRYQQSERVGLGLNVQAPRYSAGCGGIDVYMGGISAVNKSQFRDSLTSIAKNSASMAFLLALKVVSPLLTDVVGKVKAQASEYLNYSMDSCNVAKGVIGGSYAQVDSDVQNCIVRKMGGKKGTPILDADYNDAAYECATEQATKSDNGSESTEENLIAFVHGNIFWEAITNHPESTFRDIEFAELIMNIVGTKIYVAGENRMRNTISASVSKNGFMPRGERMFNTLLYGFENYETTYTYHCDEPQYCLHPNTRAMKKFEGMYATVKKALDGIVTNVHNDEPLTPSQRGILASARIPLYKYITVAAAHSPIKNSAGAIELNLIDKYTDFVARDIVMNGLMDAVSLTKNMAEHMENGISDSDEVREYIKSLELVMDGLLVEDRKTAMQSEAYFQFFDDIRMWEKLVLSKLAHTVTASMMWEN